MIPFSDLHNFYDALPLDLRTAMDKVSSFRDLSVGGIILKEGQISQRLCQIVSGEAKVSSTTRDGREITVVLVRGGDWISISEMFSGLPCPADVVATTPVRLRTIGFNDVRALMGSHPVLAEQLLRTMSLRFSMLYHLGVDRTVLCLKERVIKTLYMQAFSHGQCAAHQRNVVIALSQEELGKLLSASRQNLNRALKELEREGLLELTYGGVCVLGLEPIRQRYAYLVEVDQPAPVYPD